MSETQPARCECKWANWHKAQAEKATQLQHIAEQQSEVLRSGIRVAKTPAKTTSKVRIPALKPHSIAAYITAIPKAVAAGQLSAAQGNGMLYAAQLLISLVRATTPTPTPRPLGFTKGKK